MNTSEAINVLYKELKCIENYDSRGCLHSCEKCNLRIESPVKKEAYTTLIGKIISKKAKFTELENKLSMTNDRLRDHIKDIYCINDEIRSLRIWIRIHSVMIMVAYILLIIIAMKLRG